MDSPAPVSTHWDVYLWQLTSTAQCQCSVHICSWPVLTYTCLTHSSFKMCQGKSRYVFHSRYLCASCNVYWPSPGCRSQPTCWVLKWAFHTTAAKVLTGCLWSMNPTSVLVCMVMRMGCTETIRYAATAQIAVRMRAPIKPQSRSSPILLHKVMLAAAVADCGMFTAVSLCSAEFGSP